MRRRHRAPERIQAQKPTTHRPAPPDRNANPRNPRPSPTSPLLLDDGYLFVGRTSPYAGGIRRPPDQSFASWCEDLKSAIQAYGPIVSDHELEQFRDDWTSNNDLTYVTFNYLRHLEDTNEVNE